MKRLLYGFILRHAVVLKAALVLTILVVAVLAGAAPDWFDP